MGRLEEQAGCKPVLEYHTGPNGAREVSISLDDLSTSSEDSSEDTEVYRAATASPQDPRTASRQVDDETADVANPNATCAGPTRPAGAPCEAADKPLEGRAGERADMADDEAATVSSATCQVADDVESAGKVCETAEGAGGQGAGAAGPRDGAEDEVARGEGANARASQGASGDKVCRVYSHSPQVPART